LVEWRPERQPHSPEPSQICGVVQTAQPFPPLPHAALVSPFWQVPLVSQQPSAHVVALQTPQTCGVPPPAPHVSGLVHVAHACPPMPQAALVSPFWQMPLVSQQPRGQFAGPHTPHAWGVPPPAPQMSGLVHVAHACPPMPQAALVSPLAQAPLASQHPCGQVVALQIPQA
jgi:hypothetical protein